MFTKLFIIVIALYVVSTTVYYWLDSIKWTINSTRTRKTFYLLYVLGLGSGIFIGVVDMSKWQEIIQYVGIAVFVDIAIYQTPNITKFANTEFEHNELIEQAIKENSKEFRKIEGKQNLLLQIIQKTEATLSSKPNVISFQEYSYELKEHLSYYTEVYDLKVRICEFKKNVPNDELKQDIQVIVASIDLTYNMGLDSFQKIAISEALSTGVMQRPSEDVFILPIFGKQYNVLIALNGEEILPTDLANISYLTYFFEWFML